MIKDVNELPFLLTISYLLIGYIYYLIKFPKDILKPNNQKIKSDLLEEDE